MQLSYLALVNISNLLFVNEHFCQQLKQHYLGDKLTGMIYFLCRDNNFLPVRSFLLFNVVIISVDAAVRAHHLPNYQYGGWRENSNIIKSNYLKDTYSTLIKLIFFLIFSQLSTHLHFGKNNYHLFTL